jgi:Right handed beta helix region
MSGELHSGHQMAGGPRHQFYVAVNGRDNWSGTLADPADDGSDGPFATIERARDVVRGIKGSGQLQGPVIVWVRGGRYARREPLLFGPKDSAPVTYIGYPGERAIIDGGRQISGWRAKQLGQLQCWVTDLPEVASGRWYFRQLFVDGERRPRPRLPKHGHFRVRESVPPLDFATWRFNEENLFDGTSSFRCQPGDIQNWKNLEHVEVVAYHWWTEERLPISHFDATSNTVVSSRRSIFALRDDAGPRYAEYYVDNVFEALDTPGEWYLDAPTGTLYYLPLPGEQPETTEVFAPLAQQLLILEGHPEDDQFVEFLQFQQIGFEHTEWSQPQGWHPLFDLEHSPFPLRLPDVEYAAAPQAASNVPGAIVFSGARNCSIEDCRIAHVGGYGIEVREGCEGNRLVGNEVADLGAGGVKVFGAGAAGPLEHRTGRTQVTDNHIHGGGQVFLSGVGVLLAHSYDSAVSHNHIHDFQYSGVSCGWVWRYGNSISKNNRLEFNHIHDIGHGLLSDMGGIYTLGAQPGTVIRGNLIHDVVRRAYGGWGIYLDEGSAHVLVEGNLAFDVTSEPFHQHFGRENIVRGNIFAFGGEGQVALGRSEAHTSFNFFRNIVITDGQPLFVGGSRCHLYDRPFVSDLNVLWDAGGRPIVAGDGPTYRPEGVGFDQDYSLQDLQSLGYDRHSVVGDPQFGDLEKRDFTLTAGSPAFELGFEAFDLSSVGPRPLDERGAIDPVAEIFFP